MIWRGSTLGGWVIGLFVLVILTTVNLQCLALGNMGRIDRINKAKGHLYQT
jgi:hypothetical protein